MSIVDFILTAGPLAGILMLFLTGRIVPAWVHAPVERPAKRPLSLRRRREIAEDLLELRDELDD